VGNYILKIVGSATTYWSNARLGLILPWINLILLALASPLSEMIGPGVPLGLNPPFVKQILLQPAPPPFLVKWCSRASVFDMWVKYRHSHIFFFIPNRKWNLCKPHIKSWLYFKYFKYQNRHDITDHHDITDRHDITEILLKVALSSITITSNSKMKFMKI